VRNSPSEGMISVEDFKSIMIDIITAMVERVGVAEEKVGNCFRDRTNIYGCEDDRPICYCCLRVGYVAKYCWDRRYSCPYASVPTNVPTPWMFQQHDSFDVQSLGRDVDKLLKELQGITKELELSQTAPFQAEDISSAPERVTYEKEELDCRKKRITSIGIWCAAAKGPSC